MRTDRQTDGEKDQSSQSSACGVDLSNRGPAKPDSDTETKDVQSEQGRTGKQTNKKKHLPALWSSYRKKKSSEKFLFASIRQIFLKGVQLDKPAGRRVTSCFISAFLLLKCICTCETHTHTDTQVLCVCILFFYVLYVKHFFVLGCRGYRYKNLKRGLGNTHSQHQPQHCYLSS